MIDPLATGRMWTSLNRGANEIGTVRVTFSRNTVSSDVDGKPLTGRSPTRVELRLIIEVHRDGKRVAVSQIPLDPIATSLADFVTDYNLWRLNAGG